MPRAILHALVGTWEGTARTWFEPEVLADESAVSGTIESLPGERFVRHRYTGSMQGKPRWGEETLSYNSVTGLYQVAWMDSFHMSATLLISDGPATDGGFTVLGHYDTSPTTPRWGWRTRYQLLTPDDLVITAFNVIPDEGEARAVETVLRRVATT